MAKDRYLQALRGLAISAVVLICDTGLLASKGARCRCRYRIASNTGFLPHVAHLLCFRSRLEALGCAH